jgi:hypothetical protein
MVGGRTFGRANAESAEARHGRGIQIACNKRVRIVHSVGPQQNGRRRDAFPLRKGDLMTPRPTPHVIETWFRTASSDEAGWR